MFDNIKRKRGIFDKVAAFYKIEYKTINKSELKSFRI